MMSIDEQALAVERLEAPDEDFANTSSSGNFAAEYFARREAVMRVVGFVMFVFSVPLTALLIVIVRCTSRGPGIYRQTREGKNGKPFTMYKLRTMRQDAEILTGPVWAAENDPRLTRLGALLRFLHLDELPQLWNVARGDMDLVGPRPERPKIVEELVEVIPSYAERLVVKPGITGIAQINLPPDTDYESVARKLYLDLQYIESASVSLDIRILLCTTFRMIGIRHGRAVSLLGLGRRVPESALLMIIPQEREAESFCEPLSAMANGGGNDVSVLRHRAR